MFYLQHTQKMRASFVVVLVQFGSSFCLRYLRSARRQLFEINMAYLLSLSHSFKIVSSLICIWNRNQSV